jgi:hypothetical protein
MGIGLMADVPDKLVLGRIEDTMKRNGEFDYAKARTEMAAGHRNDIDRFLPQFARKRRQSIPGQRAQIGGKTDFIKDRCFKTGHENL